MSRGVLLFICVSYGACKSFFTKFEEDTVALGCSPNFPHASYLDICILPHEPVDN